MLSIISMWALTAIGLSGFLTGRHWGVNRPAVQSMLSGRDLSGLPTITQIVLEGLLPLLQ
ncbi:hypothetical protein [Gloeobacter violaceus]|nr:hypothetical protein [Gloeobacter violaceus]